jgi:hypothetical protein
LPIVFELSNFSEMLYEQSITLITCFGLFAYDDNLYLINETSDADNIRKELGNKKQLIPSWLSFSAGYELLFKAVLAKHKILQIGKKGVSEMKETFIKGTSIDSVRTVYYFVEEARVSSADDYLKNELSKHRITKIYDFSTGTLGSSIGILKKLVDRKVISDDERAFLHAATQTLLDVRRNVDAHTFFGLTVGKSINGDLENVYLPAINLLLNAYHRPIA